MSAKKQGRLIKRFVAGTTARAASEIVRVQTAIRFYIRLKAKLIASQLPSYTPAKSKLIRAILEVSAKANEDAVLQAR